MKLWSIFYDHPPSEVYSPAVEPHPLLRTIKPSFPGSQESFSCPLTKLKNCPRTLLFFKHASIIPSSAMNCIIHGRVWREKCRLTQRTCTYLPSLNNLVLLFLVSVSCMSCFQWTWKRDTAYCVQCKQSHIKFETSSSCHAFELFQTCQLLAEKYHVLKLQRRNYSRILKAL